MNAGASFAVQHHAIAKLAYTHIILIVPLFLAMGIVIAFYALGALHSDRKNRSIWLWRSLPISDAMTVWSKVAFALGVAPLVTITCIALSLVIFAIVMCIAGAIFDFNIFNSVLWQPATLRLPFQAIALWTIYVFWALPTIGWFLLISAVVKRAPFVWAIALPLVAVAIISTMNMLFKLNHSFIWVRDEIILRAVTSTVPGAWTYYLNPQISFLSDPNISSPTDWLLVANWQSVHTPTFWVGTIVGILLITLAIRCRRWRE